MDVLDLLGTTLGLAFVAGINLYATVLVVGLGVQFGLIELPAELNGLNLLTHPAILVAAGIAYTVEFFADKIPSLGHVAVVESEKKRVRERRIRLQTAQVDGSDLLPFQATSRGIEKVAESIRLVEKGEVILITRHGKPVAALVTPSEIEGLDRLRSRTPDDGLAGLVGKWSDSDELVRGLEKNNELQRDSKPFPSLE